MQPSSPEHPSRPNRGGSIEVAQRWLTLILGDDNLASAWPLTAPDYRLALTQAIIFLNENAPMLSGHDRDDLVEQLATSRPHHPLWSSFAGLLAEEFSVDLGGIDTDAIEGATVRVIGDDLELVLFPAYDANGDDDVGDLHAHGVLLKLQDDHWMVAGLSQRPATPGWPPDLGY